MGTGQRGIDSLMPQGRTFPPPSELQATACIGSPEQYRELYERSINDPEAFWLEQSELLTEIRAEIEDLYKGLGLIRDVRSQVQSMGQWLQKADMKDDEVEADSKAMLKKLKEVEEKLTQTKSKSNQDPLNYPPMLDNQFLTLYDYVAGSEYRPTSGAYERLDDLRSELRPILKSLDGIVEEELDNFSKLLKKKNIGAIIVPK